MRESQRKRLGLPPRVFLYTVDQVALMLGVTEASVKRHLHFMGRSPGPCPSGKLAARNIAAEGERPDWRVAEDDFVRFVRRAGFEVFDPSSIRFRTSK